MPTSESPFPDSLLPHRPSKVIAVHLSYRSRAAQRGRTPATPSYFFKPVSSLGYDGGSVERPTGTELLAFEGEIALIIGTAARRVSVQDAWSHIAAVTASNDLGIYDLRALDKGSNVRSKGGDGFTPIGPQLLDAGALDPARLRVRTWLNGDLVQEGTVADLLFPLPQFVADLSQHFTLQPGDIILTGTPAGSSVAEPGDLIEVEVDGMTGDPGGSGGAGQPVSTGRLRTRVVQGDLPFNPEVGGLPNATDEQRVAAYGSAPAADVATDSSTGLSPELREKLLAAPLASLSSQLRRRGLDYVSIDGVRPLHPGEKMVGTAATLRFVPFREDLFTEHGGGYNAQKRAFDALRPGDVMVIEARGIDSAGTLGDILALRAQACGAAGVVTDGAIRDHAPVAEVGLPVYHQGAHPAVLGRRHVPWDYGITISCGGATVQPGDIIVGDADGVLVIPPALAEEVADAALAQEESDAFIAEQVAGGERLDGLFPMNADWQARYQATRTSAGHLIEDQQT